MDQRNSLRFCLFTFLMMLVLSGFARAESLKGRVLDPQVDDPVFPRTTGGVAPHDQHCRRLLAANVASLGLGARLAGDRAIEVGVSALGQADLVLARLAEVGEALKSEDGADVLLLGCAGMARHRKALQDRLGIPVVDPVQAAVGLAQITLQTEAQA